MTTFIVITAITMILVRVLIVAIIIIMLRRWVVIQSTDDDDDELRISGLVGFDIRSPERPPYKPILAGLLGIFNC